MTAFETASSVARTERSWMLRFCATEAMPHLPEAGSEKVTAYTGSVSTTVPNIIETYAVQLAAARIGAVYHPVFAGFAREEIYVTNAVKHFKFVRTPKRRIHQTPGSTEIEACRPWLAAELASLTPRAAWSRTRCAPTAATYSMTRTGSTG